MFKNGDGALQFTEQEAKILAKKKQLIFPAESMSSLANQLVHVGFNIADKIPENKQKASSGFDHISTKNEKKVKRKVETVIKETIKNPIIIKTKIVKLIQHLQIVKVQISISHK